MSRRTAKGKTKAVRPGLGWFLLLDGGVALLAAVTFSEPANEAVSNVVPLPPKPVLETLLWGTVVVHIGEALAARRGARRRGLPTGPWVRQTFVVGFPSLRKLATIPTPE